MSNPGPWGCSGTFNIGGFRSTFDRDREFRNTVGGARAQRPPPSLYIVPTVTGARTPTVHNYCKQAGLSNPLIDSRV